MTADVEGALAAFPAADTGVSVDDIPFLRVEPDGLLEAITRLRDDLGYARFVDVTAVDHPEEAARFELQYLLYSMAERRWLRVKVRTNDAVPSVTPLFAGADWFEREVFDLFGVRFEGHPNLVRILMPDEWDGYPLRRDYPIGGEPVDFTVTRDIYDTGDRRG